MARRRLAATAGVIVAGVAVLRLSTALDWAREHVLTAAGVAVLVAVAGLVVPFLVARHQRGLSRHDTADKERRARDRDVMLKRVRNRWITGVLEQSLAHEARIRLGLTRRPEVIWQPDMLRRRPSGTPISAVFDKLGGGLCAGADAALACLAGEVDAGARSKRVPP
ncbi:MAG: hypothetical protein ACRDYX_15950 [Egibacteraceae bacterium]